MAATTTQAPSKSSKNKAAQSIERADSPAPSTSSGQVGKFGDEGFESPYIKELHKNIRNINKKISNASKTDSVVAQHKGKSLDDLVSAKIINTDQKNQIQKKPALQAQLAQLEEQLVQYQKVHEQYQSKAAADKADWEKDAESARTSAINQAKDASKKSLNESLLVLSQFLRLAAYRREDGQDPESDESQAIEGVLLAIYSGDESAVEAMLKLVEGSTEAITSVPGEDLQTTYSAVKSLAQAQAAAAPPQHETAGVQVTPEIGTDPTMANATATELEAGDATLLNGSAPSVVTNGISNIGIGSSGNDVAETHWDAGNDNSVSQDWVDVAVPRDPTETETGLQATPAAPEAVTASHSWADDQPDPVPQVPSTVPAEANDGFHQVQRHKSRSEREGGSGTWRGGRGRGSFRGRGRGGEGRGRGGGGRGNDRNSGVPSRPRRNNAES